MTRIRLAISAVSLLALSGAVACAAAADAVAEIAAHRHQGVATCSSSTCHGATQPFRDSNVQQNEFSRWQEYDPHATRAWQVLGSAEGQAIARKLGLGDATAARVCLDCHADNVPDAMRGERFQLSDGVGCEACHGGAEQWISSHADKSASHADNLARGLYPTEDPVRRAELCLSCHMGVPERMITHRIMGAGHPRLSFELDTFTWINPHYEIDEDYIQRKGEFNGLRDWGVGQGVAAANLLDILLSDQHGWNGIFPELVLFDCHACHRRMDGNRWGPRQGTGLGPGVVRLNDANLVMFRHVLAAVDTGAAQRIMERTRDLHRATTTSREATRLAAQQLRTDIGGLLPRVATHDFGPQSMSQILDSLLRDADRGEYRDFAAAEQAAMAASSVVVAFETAGSLEAERAETLRTRVDALYARAEDGERYDMQSFIAALRALRGAAP
ncbi:MAG TPA: multiheme c-type cytochrome [Xanthomonadaceae bacterium]|nr:multiheme c-type cytochrome [Xanthomonadaceae bacterium]